MRADPIDEVRRLEALTIDAQRAASAAGLSVPEWLARMPVTERQKWDGVEGMLECWAREHREMRERDDWRDRLYRAIDQRGIQGPFSYWFLVYAEHELRVQGIALAEQRAVDYVLDVLMPKAPMGDERPWYNLVHQ